MPGSELITQLEKQHGQRQKQMQRETLTQGLQCAVLREVSTEPYTKRDWLTVEQAIETLAKAGSYKQKTWVDCVVPTPFGSTMADKVSSLCVACPGKMVCIVR